MSTRLIVVEDEALVRASLCGYLAREGYRVREAADVAACRAALKAERAEIVIIDLGLPGADGVTLVRELRDDPTIDVIVVTRRSALEHRVRTLDEGADDYLVKPIEFAELSARIRVLERRRGLGARLSLGAWTLDLASRAVFGANGAPVALTRGEFDLLHQLVRANGKIVTREALSSAVSRSEDADVRSVDALVSRIRRKLGAGAEHVIVTAPGFGYRLGESAIPERAARSAEA